MTRTKKPPTLAELRRLAKRKGYADLLIRGHEFVVGSTENPPDIRIVFWLHRRTEARRVMFAALSALPDAPKASRHE